jgi:hypothetical protein
MRLMPVVEVVMAAVQKRTSLQRAEVALLRQNRTSGQSTATHLCRQLEPKLLGQRSMQWRSLPIVFRVGSVALPNQPSSGQRQSTVGPFVAVA